MLSKRDVSLFAWNVAAEVIAPDSNVFMCFEFISSSFDGFIFSEAFHHEYQALIVKVSAPDSSLLMYPLKESINLRSV